MGLFRKPGVRSRIQKLRELHESNELVDYSQFGACDIADLVKTYFRELPEVLVTNKLSEIFITICQCKFYKVSFCVHHKIELLNFITE